MKTIVIKNINKEITAVNLFTYCYFDFFNLTSLIISIFPSFDENVIEQNLKEQHISSTSLSNEFYVDGRKLSFDVSLSEKGVKITTLAQSSGSGKINFKTKCKKLQKGEEKKYDKIEMITDLDGKVLSKTGSCNLERIFNRGITSNSIQINL